MKAAGVPTVPAGYAILAPYQITLSLAGSEGDTASATCQSPTLIAGAGSCVFRGPATATAGLRLPGPSQDGSSHSPEGPGSISARSMTWSRRVMSRPRDRRRHPRQAASPSANEA